MTRINPMDLSFLLLEKANRPLHMAAFMIFQKPKGQQSSFGPRLFEAYRHSQAVKPFNYKLKWLGKDVAAWETVEPDMRNHIRHIDLPAPGSMQQFHETVSFLNTSLLDRGHPPGLLYLAGAPMVAFHGLPILPPGAGLNITFASVNTDICLAIGAAPEAVHEPFRLAQLIEEAFHNLQVEAGETGAQNRTSPAPASVIGTSTKQHRTRRTQ